LADSPGDRTVDHDRDSYGAGRWDLPLATGCGFVLGNLRPGAWAGLVLAHRVFELKSARTLKKRAYKLDIEHDK
jgi:hypothetical protein